MDEIRNQPQRMAEIILLERIFIERNISKINKNSGLLKGRPIEQMLPEIRFGRGNTDMIIFFITILSILMIQPGIPEKMVIDFASEQEKGKWIIINDGVMGGLSKSMLYQTPGKTGIFEGKVSLENYGGFASVRTKPSNYSLEGFDGIRLRLKGDGKIYSLRLRNDDNFDGVSYMAEFKTRPGTWQEITIPFSDFNPTFRGRMILDMDDIDPSGIRQIGFLIGNKQEGAFKLEVAWIKAYVGQ